MFSEDAITFAVYNAVELVFDKKSSKFHLMLHKSCLYKAERGIQQFFFDLFKKELIFQEGLRRNSQLAELAEVRWSKVPLSLWW